MSEALNSDSLVSVPRAGAHPKPVWVVDDDRSIRWVFEKALGRVALWAPKFPGASRDIRHAEFVRRLRIYPHALRQENAYYSPDKSALLFGYFDARPTAGGEVLPGGVLPIACTGSSDYLCLDIRQPSAPVVFWDRRPSWGNNVWREDDLYPVAPDFDALLQSLRDESSVI